MLDFRFTRLPGPDPVWQVHDGDRLLGTVEEGFGAFLAQTVEGRSQYHADQKTAAKWLLAEWVADQ